MENEHAKLPPPPGLVASIAAGFDSVANSIAVIALPVLFDLFLWFGPHMRLQKFLQPFIENLPRLGSNLATAGSLQVIQQTYTEFAARFNLFSLLRTFPVGISSLLTFKLPMLTPLGEPPMLESASFPSVAGWALISVLAGWMVGALYYHWVSRIALKAETHPLGRSVVQVLILSVVWTALALVAGLPLLMLVSVVTLVSPALGQVFVFITGMLLLWMLIPVYFSAHGIFAFQLDALSAIMRSLRMVRYTLPGTGMFLLMIVLISQGLRFLWNTPAADTWWMLVGILGHAFISTSLLAASFIYYRNVNDWLKVVFENMKARANTASA